MAGNFFEDFLIIAPNFLAIICILSSSLSIFYFPNLTIVAAIANLVVGIYFIVRGYSSSEDKYYDNNIADYNKFVGWLLILSAIALGLKNIFIGNKIVPKISALILGKKNMTNNISTK
jgi:hypothetical protein